MAGGSGMEKMETLKSVSQYMVRNCLVRHVIIACNLCRYSVAHVFSVLLQ